MCSKWLSTWLTIRVSKELCIILNTPFAGSLLRSHFSFSVHEAVMVVASSALVNVLF